MSCIELRVPVIVFCEEPMSISDVAQRVVAAATAPHVYHENLRAVPNNVLLAALGAERGTSSAATSAGPLSTTLVVQRRLNEEYRARSVQLRDAFEDAVAALRQHHRDVVKILTPYMEEGVHEAGAATESIPNASRDTSPRQTPRTMESRCMAAQQPAVEVEDGSARRLAAFWKSKFESTCRALEVHHEELSSLRARFDAARLTDVQDPRSLSALTAQLREQEHRERVRADGLKARYVSDARRLGLTPVEPDVGVSTTLPRAWPQKATNGEPVLSSALLLRDRMDYVSDLRRRIDNQTRARIEADQTYSSALDEFTNAAGAHNGPTAPLLEECIRLATEIDALEAQEFDNAVEDLHQTTEMLTTVRYLTCDVESNRLTLLEKEKKSAAALRQAELDRLRAERAVEPNAAQAPQSVPSSDLEVLKAKLEAAEGQLALLRRDKSNLSHAAGAVYSTLQRESVSPSK